MERSWAWAPEAIERTKQAAQMAARAVWAKLESRRLARIVSSMARAIILVT